jgi:hypothetical protein
MTRDSLRLGSRLPADPEYWEGLAQRIACTSRARLRRSGTIDGSPWWSGLARLSPTLAASAIVATLAAWALLPDRGTVTATDPGGDLAQILQPDDPIVRRFLSDPSPPPLGEVLAWVP